MGRWCVRVPGWGVSLSGGLNLFAHDALTVQGTYGEGIARYVRDPSGANEDAALDSHGKLRALPVWGVAVGYTHAWADKWKSTVSYGYADVDTEASNGQFAFDHSNYVSGNLIYQWSPSFRLGVEYLYGTKEVRNGASHNGQRLNFAEPKVHKTETRCYIRDPDGYLIEVGQTTITAQPLELYR